MENAIPLEKKVIAAIAHAGWMVGIGDLWVALLIWIIFGKDDFVRRHAKQAFAAQMFFLIATIVFAGGAAAAGSEIACAVFLVILIVGWMACSVAGLVKALSGESFGYPFIKGFVEH